MHPLGRRQLDVYQLGVHPLDVRPFASSRERA
jgi:hypothetical protein